MLRRSPLHTQPACPLPPVGWSGGCDPQKTFGRATYTRAGQTRKRSGAGTASLNTTAATVWFEGLRSTIEKKAIEGGDGCHICGRWLRPALAQAPSKHMIGMPGLDA